MLGYKAWWNIDIYLRNSCLTLVCKFGLKSHDDSNYSKGTSTYDVRWFWAIFDLPTYPNQMIYYISLFDKIRWSLTYLPTLKSDVICGCSLMMWKSWEIWVWYLFWTLDWNLKRTQVSEKSIWKKAEILIFTFLAWLGLVDWQQRHLCVELLKIGWKLNCVFLPIQISEEI